MEILTLRKYTASRLRGSLIRDVTLYSTGKLKVTAENGDSKDFWIDLYMGPDLADYCADYILCQLQDDVDIKISKY